MGIDKITAFKTSDGKVFESEKEAEDYESEVAIAEGLKEFVNLHFFREMFEDEMVAALMENRGTLLKILKPSRPRSWRTGARS